MGLPAVSGSCFASASCAAHTARGAQYRLVTGMPDSRQRAVQGLQRMHARLRACFSNCGVLHGFTGSQRAGHMKFFTKLAHKKKLNRDTVSLAVLCLERWCCAISNAAASASPRHPRELVAFVSLVVASKVHESETLQLHLREVDECTRQYTFQQAAALELEMLDHLNWRINVPTPNEFCRHLVAAVALEYEEEREDTGSDEPDWQHLLLVAERLVEWSHTSTSALACCPATTAYAAALAGSRCQKPGRWTPAAQDVMMRLAQENGLDLPLVNSSADHFHELYRENERCAAAKLKLRESPDCVANFDSATNGATTSGSSLTLSEHPIYAGFGCTTVAAGVLCQSPRLLSRNLEVHKPTALKPVLGDAFPIWGACPGSAPKRSALQFSTGSCFKRARLDITVPTVQH
ncbi:hypothetical protein JKP88DRAFT_252500 [Tribonema minus]|uniref:Cyclin N-terminal domain-containing protein n=1 Tax=Tribonema minus TaxID=303371 RepID=A0A836CKV7_9STRA|nr:hypothetical protein JKP88DRAFT_252500 [Tribonema minus]